MKLPSSRPRPKFGPGRYPISTLEKIKNAATRKATPKNITMIIPIGFVIDFTLSPKKPVKAKIKTAVTITTANKGTIVPTYFTAPPAETKTVATRKANTNCASAFSPRSFVLFKIAKTTATTIRKTAIGTRSAKAVNSAGMFYWCLSPFLIPNQTASPAFLSRPPLLPPAATAIIIPTNKAPKTRNPILSPIPPCQ